MVIEDIKPPSWWVKKKRAEADRRHIKKLISKFETMGGTIDNKAVLIVYDANYPEKTYIITENL